jgi:hypothetical protein
MLGWYVTATSRAVGFALGYPKKKIAGTTTQRAAGGPAAETKHLPFVAVGHSTAAPPCLPAVCRSRKHTAGVRCAVRAPPQSTAKRDRVPWARSLLLAASCLHLHTYSSPSAFTIVPRSHSVMERYEFHFRSEFCCVCHASDIPTEINMDMHGFCAYLAFRISSVYLSIFQAWCWGRR